MQYKICLVGEAWGEEEERQLLPFVGPSGRELTRMLDQAGIHRADCFLTNVFNLRPRPTNDITNLCTDRANVSHNLEPLSSGKYIRDEYLPELGRLAHELRDCAPNIIIALGGTAAWATTGSPTISKARGTVCAGFYGKTLATYHPAAILRQWELRHVTILDLIKAKAESEFPDVRRPSRKIWIEPGLSDMERFYDQYLRDAEIISFDIETAKDQITCIGFASSTDACLVVPFTDLRRAGGSYWPDATAERAAWEFVRKVLQLPVKKVGQNTLYDIHFLWRRYGITVRNYEHDTMLLHHALHPESQKGLDFLGSVYTNEASWKLMRKRGKSTIKKDE